MESKRRSKRKPKVAPVSATYTTVKVVDLQVPEEFYSSKSKHFRAIVTTENSYNLEEAIIQVVFKGYIRNSNTIEYEFLYEQCFIQLHGKGKQTNEVELDARLHRLPPTMKIDDQRHIEYCCLASADPWYENTHQKKVFRLIRDEPRRDTMKANSIRYTVNECAGHGGWCHRHCEAINGDFWIDRNVFTTGEKLNIRWRIKSNSDLDSAVVLLNRKVWIR